MLKFSDLQIGKMVLDITIVNNKQKQTYSYEIGKDAESSTDAILKSLQKNGNKSGETVRVTERVTTDVIVEIE